MRMPSRIEPGPGSGACHTAWAHLHAESAPPSAPPAPPCDAYEKWQVLAAAAGGPHSRSSSAMMPRAAAAVQGAHLCLCHPQRHLGYLFGTGGIVQLAVSREMLPASGPCKTAAYTQHSSANASLPSNAIGDNMMCWLLRAQRRPALFCAQTCANRMPGGNSAAATATATAAAATVGATADRGLRRWRLAGTTQLPSWHLQGRRSTGVQAPGQAALRWHATPLPAVGWAHSCAARQVRCWTLAWGGRAQRSLWANKRKNGACRGGQAKECSAGAGPAWGEGSERERARVRVSVCV